MLSESQVTCARMIARGHSRRMIARTLHIGRETIRQWERDPEFAQEVERAVERGGAPDPRGVLLDALTARRDDGVDWQARLKAAFALLEENETSGDDRRVVAGEW